MTVEPPTSPPIDSPGPAEPDVSGAILLANLTAFGRLLRRMGLPIGPHQTRLFAQMLTVMGVGRKGDVRAAGRAIYTTRREHREPFDAAFDLFWRRAVVRGAPSTQLPRLRQLEPRPADVTLAPQIEQSVRTTNPEAETLPVGASTREALRTADFADLTPSEARDAAAMLSALRPQLPLRPSRRPRIGRRGHRLATRTMIRRSLTTGGEAVTWHWLRRRRRPRPVVLVCDISGSMERYTRFLLRFAHALTRSGAPVEVFVFGTRLTRITRELRHRHPDRALRDVAAKVVDWSGGTKIGASLRELNRRWVRRTVRSGAVVLLVSDGWERDDPATLEREIATLQRSCHRLIWLDPLASRPGFAPSTLGLRAALPYVDAFLPCATVASLEELAGRLGSFGR